MIVHGSIALLLLLGAVVTANDPSCPLGFGVVVEKPGAYYSTGNGSNVFTDEMDAQMPLVKGRFADMTCYVNPVPNKPIRVSFATGPCGKPIDFEKGMMLEVNGQAIGETKRKYPVTTEYEQTCYSVKIDVQPEGKYHVNCSVEVMPRTGAKGSEA